MAQLVNLPPRVQETDLKDLLKQMWLIRYFEEKVDEFFAKA